MYFRFDGIVLTLKFFSRPYTLGENRTPSSPVQESACGKLLLLKQKYLISSLLHLLLLILEAEWETRRRRTINRRPALNLRSWVACLEVWLLTLSVTYFGKPPRSETWGTPTMVFVSHLTKPETTSQPQVKMIHYLVRQHQLERVKGNGGEVLPENMPLPPMEQKRQVKTTPHFSTWKFRNYSVAWILQVPNRGVSLTRELRGALFVPYLTNPETTKHRSTLYRQGPTSVPLQPGGQSLLDTCQDQKPIRAWHVSTSRTTHNMTHVNVTKLQVFL